MTFDLTPYQDAIERELRSFFHPPEESVAPFYNMMRYHLGWLDAHFQPDEAPHGKRLRPVMCLLACEASGGEWERALPAAAAIELIHSFSLLHDDIEDGSATRRHRATVWSLWGIAQAINAGDAMWAMARLAVYRLLDRGYEAESVLRVASRLDSACLDLCVGQYLDVHSEETELISVSEYGRMIASKTAALISASLVAGAILGGASGNVLSAYAFFGHELGLAYQITDDILGIWGDPSVTGKSAASDILSKKKTMPVLYALQREREQGEGHLAAIYARRALSEDDLPVVLELLETAGALGHSHAQAEEHLERALTQLQATGMEGPAQDAIRDLALSVLDRSS